MLEIGEALRLEEIEALAGHFNVCPKCGSREGFWLGVKRDRGYVQCKGCGASFELFEVFSFGEKREVSRRLSFW